MTRRQEHQTKIPKLRFREFQGEWNSIPGGKIFDSISDKKHNSDLPILAITQDRGAIPRDLIEFNISVTDKSIEGYKVVRKGDFIISLRSFQGGIEYSEYDGICSPAYIILRPNTEIIDYFFKALFKTDKYITEMNRKLEGIRDGKMVSYTYFSEININHPSIPEQQKIASFLSKVDEKIEKLKTKKSLLEKYKKGVMQKIFAREIRFKDENGKEFGEWEEKEIKTLFDLTEEIAKPINFNKHNLITVKLHCAGIIKNERNGNLSGGTNYSIRKAGQFIFSKIDFLGGAFGIIPDELDGFLSSSDIPAFSFKKNIVPYFFQYWLSEKYKKLKIERTGTSSTLKRISIESFFNIILALPTFPEQEKIASFLSELDKKIDMINSEIECAEKWKKGLLQQIFV